MAVYKYGSDYKKEYGVKYIHTSVKSFKNNSIVKSAVDPKLGGQLFKDYISKQEAREKKFLQSIGYSSIDDFRKDYEKKTRTFNTRIVGGFFIPQENMRKLLQKYRGGIITPDDFKKLIKKDLQKMQKYLTLKGTEAEALLNTVLGPNDESGNGFKKYKEYMKQLSGINSLENINDLEKEVEFLFGSQGRSWGYLGGIQEYFSAATIDTFLGALDQSKIIDTALSKRSNFNTLDDKNKKTATADYVIRYRVPGSIEEESIGISSKSATGQSKKGLPGKLHVYSGGTIRSMGRSLFPSGFEKEVPIIQWVMMNYAKLKKASSKKGGKLEDSFLKVGMVKNYFDYMFKILLSQAVGQAQFGSTGDILSQSFGQVDFITLRNTIVSKSEIMKRFSKNYASSKKSLPAIVSIGAKDFAEGWSSFDETKKSLYRELNQITAENSEDVDESLYGEVNGSIRSLLDAAYEIALGFNVSITLEINNIIKSIRSEI